MAAANDPRVWAAYGVRILMSESLSRELLRSPDEGMLIP